MDVFVYGTLTDPAQAGAVIDEFAYRGRAELSGFHRVDGEYPTLAPGGSVTGRILATDEGDALDRYEGVDSGLYVRVSVPVAGASGGGHGDGRPGDSRLDDGRPDGTLDTVETYVGDPGRLDAPVEWPGGGPFGERVRHYVDENDVIGRFLNGKTFDDFERYAGEEQTDAATDHDDWGTE